MTLLLAPKVKHNYISTKYWNALANPDTIQDFNWSGYVIQDILAAAAKVHSLMKDGKAIPNIASCVLFPQVFYLDNLDFGKLNIYYHSTPRIALYNKGHIKLLMENDRVNSSNAENQCFGSKLPQPPEEVIYKQKVTAVPSAHIFCSQVLPPHSSRILSFDYSYVDGTFGSEVGKQFQELLQIHLDSVSNIVNDARTSFFEFLEVSNSRMRIDLDKANENLSRGLANILHNVNAPSALRIYERKRKRKNHKASSQNLLGGQLPSKANKYEIADVCRDIDIIEKSDRLEDHKENGSCDVGVNNGSEVPIAFEVGMEITNSGLVVDRDKGERNDVADAIDVDDLINVSEKFNIEKHSDLNLIAPGPSQNQIQDNALSPYVGIGCHSNKEDSVPDSSLQVSSIDDDMFARMEKLLAESKDRVLGQNFCQKLSEESNLSPDQVRSGVVTQVEGCFNKLSTWNTKPTCLPAASEEKSLAYLDKVSASRKKVSAFDTSLSNNEDEVSPDLPKEKRGRILEIADLEFEARSARDDAWYDVAFFLAHRRTNFGEVEVRVRFKGFGAEEDEWVNIKQDVRERSIPVESPECQNIAEGDLVLCFKESDDYALHFDAHVMEIHRREHDVRGCRCVFLVKYDHDRSQERVDLKRLCRRPTN